MVLPLVKKGQAIERYGLIQDRTEPGLCRDQNLLAIRGREAVRQRHVKTELIKHIGIAISVEQFFLPWGQAMGGAGSPGTRRQSGPEWLECFNHAGGKVLQLRIVGVFRHQCEKTIQFRNYQFPKWNRRQLGCHRLHGSAQPFCGLARRQCHWWLERSVKTVAPGRLGEIEQACAINPGHSAIIGQSGSRITSEPDGCALPDQVSHGRRIVDGESLRHGASSSRR